MLGRAPRPRCARQFVLRVKISFSRILLFEIQIDLFCCTDFCFSFSCHFSLCAKLKRIF